MHILQQKILDLSDTEDLNELSLRAIGRKVGEEHPQKIKFHLEQLAKKGFFEIDDDGEITKRGEENTSFLNIPIMGEANCGEPLLIAEDEVEGFLKVSKSFVNDSNEYFGLRAVGNSMNKANISGNPINDGDYVLVRSSHQPSEGDYVVATLDNAATIKSYRKSQDSIQLVAESTESHPPIIVHKDDVDSIRIHGTVEHVFPAST